MLNVASVEANIDDADKDYIASAIDLLPDAPFDADSWGTWTGALKAQTGRKGKGLFMPLRKALTGLERGPEMGPVLVLLGREKALARLETAKA